MSMSAVKITKNKTIEFNSILGKLLDQDYVFKFFPNLSIDPNHIMMSCGHKDHEDKEDAFVFTLAQFRSLYNDMGEILNSIDMTKNAITEYSNFIDDMCTRIENHEVKSVSISIGDPITLDPDEDFFGNMYMYIKYTTVNDTAHHSDLISNEVEQNSNDVLYDNIAEYLDRGLIETFDFDMDKYNANRDKILSVQNKSINFDDIFAKLKEYEDKITNNK